MDVDMERYSMVRQGVGAMRGVNSGGRWREERNRVKRSSESEGARERERKLREGKKDKTKI
jgi:hypothetical protein